MSSSKSHNYLPPQSIFCEYIYKKHLSLLFTENTKKRKIKAVNSNKAAENETNRRKGPFFCRLNNQITIFHWYHALLP